MHKTFIIVQKRRWLSQVGATPYRNHPASSQHSKMFPLPEKTGGLTRLKGIRYLTHSLTLVRPFKVFGRLLLFFALQHF